MQASWINVFNSTSRSTLSAVLIGDHLRFSELIDCSAVELAGDGELSMHIFWEHYIEEISFSDLLDALIPGPPMMGFADLFALTDITAVVSYRGAMAAEHTGVEVRRSSAGPIPTRLQKYNVPGLYVSATLELRGILKDLACFLGWLLLGSTECTGPRLHGSVFVALFESARVTAEEAEDSSLAQVCDLTPAPPFALLLPPSPPFSQLLPSPPDIAQLRLPCHRPAYGDQGGHPLQIVAAHRARPGRDQPYVDHR